MPRFFLTLFGLVTVVSAPQALADDAPALPRSAPASASCTTGSPIPGKPGQFAIAAVERMAPWPQPLAVRDWLAVSRAYYAQAFDPDVRLDGSPLVRIDRKTRLFGFDAYVGHGHHGDSVGGEAMACIAPVIGASLCGMNPSAGHDFDYVSACKHWFDPAHGLYRNRPGQHDKTLHADIYGYWPAILGVMLADRFPKDADFIASVKTSTAVFLQLAQHMGCPDHPDFFNLGYDLDSGELAGRNEPMNRRGNAPAIAWMLMVGHTLSGDDRYLDCAEAALRFHIAHPGRYEITHLMGPLTAARLSAEYNRNVELAALLDIWFGDKSVYEHGWRLTAGHGAGDLTLDGLDGAWDERRQEAYAFTMGTLQGPAWLVPVARYRPEYAREIGRYALHAAASARYLQGEGLDDAHQDHGPWKRRWDPQNLLFYEGLRSADLVDHLRRPYATGDPVLNGWTGQSKLPLRDYWRQKEQWFANSPLNLSLYMGNHVGFLGGIVSLTNVPGILIWDCLATDYFHPPAYPTRLMYNPFEESKRVMTDVGNAVVDLYDVAAHLYVARGVRGVVTLEMAPDCAVVIVAIPAGAAIQPVNGKEVANGVVVDWRVFPKK